jgi:hypothetical protein
MATKESLVLSEVYAFTSITQQKSLIITNYNLVNAWRHVSAVLTAIFRPTYSTDQVQILRVRSPVVRTIFVPDLYYKLV